MIESLPNSFASTLASNLPKDALQIVTLFDDTHILILKTTDISPYEQSRMLDVAAVWASEQRERMHGLLVRGGDNCVEWMTSRQLSAHWERGWKC